MICGGTLIAEDWAVTAAHCVADVSENELEVIPGGHDLASAGNKFISVKRIIIHQGYDLATPDDPTPDPSAPIDLDKKHDIALLQLESPTKTGKPTSIIDPTSLRTQD